jgi:DNA-binding cell septation regulator SpoVG
MKLEISEIQITPVKPQNGLVGFASAVIYDSLYIGSIAIHTSPSTPEGYRLVFPQKTLINGKKVDIFHPITYEAGQAVTQAIIHEFEKVMDLTDNR